MKKKILISSLAAVLLLICSAAITRGQGNYEDVIYLKNGGIMRGMIIEQVPNVSLKIQCTDRNVFAYKLDEVEKITKEPVAGPLYSAQNGYQANEPDKVETARTDRVKQKGVLIIPEFTLYNFDLDHFEPRMSVGFRASVGYLFNPHLSLGAGVGCDHIYDSWYFPVFAAFRYNILKKPATPYFSLDAGYSFVNRLSSRYDKGGIMVNPAFGVKVFVAPKLALTFSLGYLYQEFKYQNIYMAGDYYNGYYQYYSPVKSEYHMLCAKLGMTI
jgi:hypothetical protein